MTITQLAQAIETQETDVAKIGPKEAALQAARADLTIPAALDRTKGMSKADFDKLHEKLGKPSNRVLQHAKDVAYRKAIKAAKPGILTEADKKAIAELKKAEKAKVEAKKAADAAKRKEEAAEKKAIRDEAKKAKATSNPATDAEIAEADGILTGSRPKAKAASAPQKPAGKPKPSPAPKTTPKAKLTSEPRKGSKAELIGNLLKRKEGCTTADVLKATGWPAVSMPQQAKAVGVKLRKEKDGKITRYWAA